ncbi:MAG TPA: 2-amino-4-hydroxy-6-hydroxymethyldihydropteridine diphosphokinase [Phycisphaerales bacterium]|nr:2-amino-4-hydroxy-6-hydroxymethyldihydropteridine diphosphokinase [Phycisphaerales bacterium]
MAAQAVQAALVAAAAAIATTEQRVPGATALIALGSNLGDRRANIESALRAIDELPRTRLLTASPLIETKAVRLPGDDHPQPDYLNAAASIETQLSPRDLLAALLDIEQRLGRDRSTGERWTARTLDLDLLLFGDQVIDEPALRVPHPEMHRRRFVLDPLARIAPNTHHPILNKTVAELLATLPQ